MVLCCLPSFSARANEHAQSFFSSVYQNSISFQKVTRGQTQLKYFGFRNVFCDFLFKRVAPEEG